MKKNGIPFFILLFLSCALPPAVFSQSVHGYDACNFLFDAMTILNADVQKEELIAADGQNYPYNTIVSFPARSKNSPHAFKNPDNEAITELRLVFSTEEAVRHIKLISDIARQAQILDLPYDLKFVFSYGDNPHLEHSASLKGAESFAFTHSGESGYCCFSVNFTDAQNAVIPCAGKTSSPLNLVKLAGKAFSSAKLKYAIDGRNLYSFYRYDILKTDMRTALFLETGIPAAGININSAQANANDAEKITAFFKNLMTNFEIWNAGNWDSHFLALKIRDKAFFIPQTFTISAFIVLLFISLFTLCEFSFWLEPLKKSVMRGVKKIWYLIPLTALLTAFSLTAGQYLSDFLYRLLNIHLFTRLSIKIAAAFFIISIVFLLIVRIQGLFSSKSYAYLLLISGIINIFLFSAIDISLFYVFAAEYVIIYASRRARRTPALSFVFAALILPFIPYAAQIVKYLDVSKASRLLHDNLSVNLLIASALLPFEFIWLKIFTRLNKIWQRSGSEKKQPLKKSVAAALGAPVVLTLFLAAANVLIAHGLKKNAEKRDVKIIAKGSGEKLSVSYSDFYYFGEVSRTVRIRLNGIPETCSLIVEGDGGNSIFYSDNSYIPEKKAETDSFLIPSYPPENMTFSYIADPEKKSVIRAGAFYLDESVRETGKRRYLFYHQNIEIPALSLGGMQ
ncbi:MAG: hypothetical protein ACTTKL_02095 [Treponema sp.]